MPTGTCNYPEHHGPSAGAPAGLVLAVIAGALIITHVHAVLVTLAVVAVLAVLGTGVVMLWHSHSSEPYDASWTDPEIGSASADLELAPTVEIRNARADLQARVVQLEQQLAERRAIEAPQQHLHIHGVTAEDVAAIIRSQHHAIEED
jgi:hypothetical protein